MSQPLCLVILTFNSERSLEAVVRSCQALKPRVVVVDSGSTDKTLDIATKLGCEILSHPFENYSRQRNWAQDTIGLTTGWFLHLDSDEVLTPDLARSIEDVLASESPSHDGFIMRRAPYFLGKRIRFGTINPTWHLRFYRAGTGRCEDRQYDQHFVSDSPAGKLKGDLLDLQLTTIEDWTASHNRWSSAEAREVWQNDLSPEAQAAGKLQASLFGDSRMKKRWIKNNIWYKLPLLLRPYLYFFYCYVIRLGFLDGRVGLIYHVLQAFWFRFLVDAKLSEIQRAEKDTAALMASLQLPRDP